MSFGQPSSGSISTVLSTLYSDFLGDLFALLRRQPEALACRAEFTGKRVGKPRCKR